MCRVVLFLILIAGCAIENVKGATSSAIPDLLYDCYGSNSTRIFQPPLTIQLLVELLRKIELDPKNAFNMRMFATSMLHGVVFDGVRKSQNLGGDDSLMMPFRATGVEFYKYKLLVDFFTSGESSLFPVDSLTPGELCFLHFMTSNTVDPWIRGDESTSCDHQSNMPFEFEALEEDDQISSCPIKKGSVSTKWGSVSARHLIAAIASVLEPMSEKFGRIEAAINNVTDKNVTSVPPTITTNINNVWVSTIAGDLASVILSQAVHAPEIGIAGFWNDTLLPRIYYLKSAKWDMTESDILGGIDGLAIASYLENNGASSLRLSQLIDMYYSERGIMSNKEYKVTNRSATLNKLLNEINLQDQVAATAKLLQRVGTFDLYLNAAEIDGLAATATDTFKHVSGNITHTYDSTEQIPGIQMKSPIEIIMIFDGTYDAYTAQQIIHALAEAAQVSHYGSKIGIINGQSGNWMANVTRELFELFTELHQVESEWPATLSLSRSLERIIYYYENSTTTDCSLEVTKPMGRSILIVSSNGRLTDNDMASSRRAFNSIKNRNPEANFILVTSPEGKTGFGELIREFRDNDHVLTPPENVYSLVRNISRTLNTIPGNFINFYCPEPRVHLEDYITPEAETVYEIRKEYIRGAQITTKFLCSNGELFICATSGSMKDKLCKDITVNGEISFDSKELCSPESTCNLEFRVSLNDSKVVCTEDSCRYPDQVRLDISWQRSSGYVPTPMFISLMVLLLY